MAGLDDKARKELEAERKAFYDRIDKQKQMLQMKKDKTESLRTGLSMDDIRKRREEKTGIIEKPMEKEV
jgi:hypothetical protein